jgi:hypothetical protein
MSSAAIPIGFLLLGGLKKGLIFPAVSKETLPVPLSLCGLISVQASVGGLLRQGCVAYVRSSREMGCGVSL